MTAEPRREPVGDDLDDAAQGIAVTVRRVDFRLHRGAGRRVVAAHRVRVDPLLVVWPRHVIALSPHRTEGHDVADDFCSEDLAQQPAGYFAERHPRRRLPCAGPLQDRPRVLETVLLHASQIRVSRAWPGQRRVAGLGRQDVRIHRVGGHHRLPFRPLGVADGDGNRAAEGHPVPDAARQLDLVLLELHPGASAVAGSPPRQRPRDVRRRDLDSGRHAVADRDQGPAVRFSCC